MEPAHILPEPPRPPARRRRPTQRLAAASVLLLATASVLGAPFANACPLDAPVAAASASDPTFRPEATRVTTTVDGLVGVVELVAQTTRIHRMLLAASVRSVRGWGRPAPDSPPARQDPVEGTLAASEGNESTGATTPDESIAATVPDEPIDIPAGRPAHVPLSAQTDVNASAFAPIQSVEMLEPGQSSQVPIEGGPIMICPVGVPHTFGDSFGAPRYAGGYHLHAGVDIFAEEGTPIYAPFDGVAEDASNTLGGRAVILRGLDGYVYNAHLSAFGTLGSVHTGDVIGYVGNSGDATTTSPHDHFEWHPNTIPRSWPESTYGVSVVGSAINPYPLLLAVC